MPSAEEEKLPVHPTSEQLRESIRQLSAQSERLKEVAEQNAREARQIAARLQAITQILGQRRD